MPNKTRECDACYNDFEPFNTETTCRHCGKLPKDNNPDWSDSLISVVRFMIGENAEVTEDLDGQVIIHTGKDSSGKDMPEL